MRAQLSLSLLLLAVPVVAQAQQVAGATHSVYSGTSLAINGCVVVSLVSGPARPGLPQGQPSTIERWTLAIDPQGGAPTGIVLSDASATERRVCACPGATVGTAVHVVVTWPLSTDPRNPTLGWDGALLTVTSPVRVAPAPGCGLGQLPPRPTGPIRPVKPISG